MVGHDREGLLYLRRFTIRGGLKGFVMGNARKALLDGVDQITGEQFKGDLWRFVDWATGSDEGKALRLDLAGP